MKSLIGFTLATIATLSVAAQAAPERARIRGTVSAVDANTLSVHTTAGEDVSVALGGNTKYLQVVKSSLGEIQKDSYIGTATKTAGSTLVALEVLIFPASMRGVGDGHYPWDPLPDNTVAGGGATSSTMTSGNVAAVSRPTLVNSMMTNGNVATATPKAGSKELTVTYKDGQQVIIVPPTAPVVTFKPGTVSDVTTGAGVFINGMKDDGKITANTVAVGMDGLKPPM